MTDGEPLTKFEILTDNIVVARMVLGLCVVATDGAGLSIGLSVEAREVPGLSVEAREVPGLSVEAREVPGLSVEAMEVPGLSVEASVEANVVQGDLGVGGLRMDQYAEGCGLK